MVKIARDACHPPTLLRNPYLQSLLASKNVRSWGGSEVRRNAREIVLTIDDSIRLLAYYTAFRSGTPKGIVVFLHGWEGSVDSAYIIATSAILYQSGYSIFRINYRDHGHSHHLNQGLFLASRLTEVFEAVKWGAQSGGNIPAFLIGFSLGGNFAMRIGRHCRHDPIKNLKHIIAISPVLNPSKTTSIIDNTHLIRNYFLKKWRRSLSKKQRLYPKHYHFEDIIKFNSIWKITEKLIQRYSGFPNANAYFNAYTIDYGLLQSLKIPTTVITSMDDPIIPIEDFDALNQMDMLRLAIQRFGGHNGFISGWLLKSWYARQIVRLLDSIVRQESK